MALGQEAYLTIPQLDKAIASLDNKIEKSSGDNLIRQKFEGMRQRYIKAKNSILKYYTKTKSKHPELVVGKRNVLKLIDVKKAGNPDYETGMAKIRGGYNFFDAVQDHRGLIVGVAATVATYSLANTISLQVAGKDFTHLIIDALAKSGLTAQAGAALGVMAGALAIIGAAYLIPAIRKNIRKGQKHRTAVKQAQNEILEELQSDDKSLNDKISGQNKAAFGQEEFDMLMDDPKLLAELRKLATSDSPRLTASQRMKLKENLAKFHENYKFKNGQWIKVEPGTSNKKNSGSAPRPANDSKPKENNILDSVEEARKAYVTRSEEASEEIVAEIRKKGKLYKTLMARGFTIPEGAVILSDKEMKKTKKAMEKLFRQALAQEDPEYLKYFDVLSNLNVFKESKLDDIIKYTPATKKKGSTPAVPESYIINSNTIFNGVIDALKNLKLEDKDLDVIKGIDKNCVDAIKTLTELGSKNGTGYTYTQDDLKKLRDSIEIVMKSPIVKSLESKVVGIEKTRIAAYKKKSVGDVDLEITDEDMKKFFDEHKGSPKAGAQESFVEKFQTYSDAKKISEKLMESDVYKEIIKKNANFAAYADLLKPYGLDASSFDAGSSLLEGDNLKTLLAGLGFDGANVESITSEINDPKKKAAAIKKINEAMAKKLGLAAEAEGPGSGK